MAAAFPLVAFREVVFGSSTLQTSTIAGVASVNGFDDIQPGPRVATSFRPDAGASAWQTEPWAEVVHDAYARGSWPLWNPYSGGGKPLAANTIANAFDPLFLGVIVRPSPRVTDFSIVGAYCIGSLATFLFLRALRARRIAALTSAAIFSLGGYWALAANNPYARGYVYIPVLLFLIDRAVRRGIGPWTFALALGVAGSILLGMPEVTFFVFAITGVYALYRILIRPRGARWPTTGNLTIAGGLGVAMALPHLVLFAEYLPRSQNTHEHGAIVGQIADPLRYLAAWFVPFLNGEPAAPYVLGDAMARAWVGGAAIALAALCVAARGRLLRARHALPFGVMFVALTWKIYHLPGSDAVGRLPVFERINWVTFGTPALQVLVAVLAGIGLDALVRRQLRVGRLVAVAVVVVVGTTLLVAANDHAIEFARISSSARRILLAAAGIAVVLVAAFAVLFWHRARTAATVVALMIVVELLVLFPTGVYAHRVDPFIRQPWFDHIEPALASSDSPEPARVFGVDGKLFPETGSGVGVYDVRMLDALYVERYFNLVKTFVDGGIADRWVGLKFTSPETGTQYVDNPIFDLLGARYIISGNADPGSIVDDLRLRLAPSDPSAVGFLRIDDIVQLALLMPSGATVDAPTPPASAAATRARGHVTNLSTVAPMTFSILGARADGTQVPLASRTVPARSPGQGSVPLAADFGGEQFDHLVLRTDSADPSANGVWTNLAYVNADGVPMSSQYRLVGEDHLTSVYENLRPTPRAFVVHDVETVPDEDAAIARMARGSRLLPGGAHLTDFDPLRTAVVETERSPVRSGTCEERATVRFADYGADSLKLVVDSPCPGLLVLTDTYYPGWKATVNGRTRDILPTDAAFRGVVVPAGRSVVEMHYRPARFRLALAIAGLAFLAGLTLSVVAVVRQRRGRKEPSPASTLDRLAS